MYSGFLPAAMLATVRSTRRLWCRWWESRMNRLRYAVSDHTVSGYRTAFTRVNGLRSVSMGESRRDNVYCSFDKAVTA